MRVSVRLVWLALLLGALLVPAAAGAATRAPQAPAATATYVNPVSKTFADTFADPSLIRGKDGYWYAYGTSDPLREGERTPHSIPIARSTNLVDWTYVGDAFSAATRPSWAAPDASIWAPDIRYVDGRYLMYYVVTQTTVTAEPNDNAVGVATAPSPTGPWTDSGAPVVAPRRGGAGEPGNFLWTFDPTEFTDVDGHHYLYYGSYYGGIWVTRLTDDGLRATGSASRVAIDNRYEGAYVVRHDGFVYLFASSANCCAGPTTGYSVYVGRSRSPLGPFVDRDGVSLNQSRVGGTIVVTPNGNRWVGPGHNAIATDLSGQDWLAYHAIDRADPFLDEPFGINERPMLLDRLDWIGGWPTPRGGYWASDSAQPAPVAAADAAGTVPGGTIPAAGCDTISTVLASSAPTNVRAEADLRPSAGAAGGVVVRYVDARTYAVAWVDTRTRSLVAQAVVDGTTRATASVPLPATLPLDVWHNLAVEARGLKLSATLTDARLEEPYAVLALGLPSALVRGRSGVAARCGPVDAANVAVTQLYREQTTTAPVPTLGTLDAAAGDEFDDATIDASWSWVRGPNADAQESGGALRWPTQNGDLTGRGGSASVLLRPAPSTGTYTVETKCTIDLGIDAIRNYQQCGLVAYVDDDLFLRLSHVAIWNTRQTEFGKEMPFADGLSYGGMLIGPPADTTWLRLAHRVDPANGEHEFRAATSRNGTSWTWGGVWTLPAGATVRVGLVSLGWNGSDPRATSSFDYFRAYTGGSWGDWPR